MIGPVEPGEGEKTVELSDVEAFDEFADCGMGGCTLAGDCARICTGQTSPRAIGRKRITPRDRLPPRYRQTPFQRSRTD